MEQTENFIQQSIVMWFNNTFCLKHHNPRLMIFSVPNDSINAIETKRKINTGLLRGASDLIVELPSKTVYVEVKTPKGTQSIDQKEFEARLRDLGREYVLIRSLNEFKDYINNQLRITTAC
jgi:histidinol-phosphate/aromatic aminotransferase/cobyric acid decarboxylase-like protein